MKMRQSTSPDMKQSSTSNSASEKLIVYYDGLCVVCDTEIQQYKKMKGSENIIFTDITAFGFSAEAIGLDPFAVHKHLHSKTPDGNIYVGVETFIQIWERLDRLNFLAKIAKKSPVRKFLELNYSLFVLVRPYLPRRSCENSPYCEIKPTK